MRKLLAAALLLCGLGLALHRAPVEGSTHAPAHAQLGQDDSQSPAGVLPQRTVRSHVTAAHARGLLPAPLQLVAPSRAQRLGHASLPLRLSSVTVRQHGARAPPAA